MVLKAPAYADSFTYDDINVKSHSFYGDADLKFEIIQKTILPDGGKAVIGMKSYISMAISVEVVYHEIKN